MEIIKQNNQQLILQQRSNPFRIFTKLIFTSIYGIIYVLFLPAMIFFGWKFISLWGVTEVNCEQIEPTIIDCEIKRTKVAGLISETKSLKNVSFVGASHGGIGLFILEDKIDSIRLADSQGNQINLERLNQINYLGGTPFLQATSLTEFNDNEFFELPYSSIKIDNRSDIALLILIAIYSLVLILSTAGLFGLALSLKKYQTKFDFNKATNKLEWQKVNLFNITKKRYNLTDINALIIEESTNWKRQKIYVLILPISNSKTYLLDSDFQLNSIQEKANQISSFLDIPNTNISNN